MVLFVYFWYCNWLTAFLHSPNTRIVLQTLLQTHCLFFPLFVIACLNTFVYTFILLNKIRWVHVSYLYVYFQCWSFGSGQPIDMFIPAKTTSHALSFAQLPAVFHVGLRPHMLFLFTLACSLLSLAILLMRLHKHGFWF